MAKQQQGEQVGGNVPSQKKIQVLGTSVLNWQKSDTFDRTIDLSSLGLDFNDVKFFKYYNWYLLCSTCQVFDQLLSPKGIIEQFVLSIGLQIMNVGG